jgi:hypothetical protein
VSVVYNIDPSDTQKLIPDVLDQLAFDWVKRGSSYYIGFAALTAGERPGAFGPTKLTVLRGGRAVLDVTVVPAMRHATLRWTFVTGDVRRRVEAELRDALAGTDAPENPVAGWLLTAATGLFALLLVMVGLFVVTLWRARA